MSFTLVDTAGTLHRLVESARVYPTVAVDTESNSLYAYTEQVCLIQLSTPDRDYLVDPLALDDLSPLGALLENPSIEKVFHAAEYDLIGLYRDFHIRVSPIFDTMWAARIVGWPRCGLAALLETHFGVTKNKRMQRYNWGRRPLSPEALRYAVKDTHYLLRLRDILAQELHRLDRWEEAREVFAELHHVIERARTPSDYDFWRIKGSRLLSPTERGVLRALVKLREEEARRQNRPRFRVMSDRLLIRLAQEQPADEDILAEMDSVPRSIARRYGTQIIAAIQEGRSQPVELPAPQHNNHVNGAAEAVYEALRNWRKKVARQRGVDPDVIVSNAVLHDIAGHKPQSQDELAELGILGPWKLRAYGPALVRVIQDQAKQSS
jgi:ribonuclease D